MQIGLEYYVEIRVTSTFFRKNEKEKFFKQLYSLVFLRSFYQISSRFNAIWLFTTHLFCTN